MQCEDAPVRQSDDGHDGGPANTSKALAAFGDTKNARQHAESPLGARHSLAEKVIEYDM
jgi:hypothetical protein